MVKSASDVEELVVWYFLKIKKLVHYYYLTLMPSSTDTTIRKVQ